MHSAIYEGNIRHRRFGPVRHDFQYPLFLMYLDLSELQDVFRGRWCWSTRGRGVAEFRRSDYLGNPAIPLAEAVRDLVETRGLPRPEGPIRLLTNLRYFGYVMNPVSFYYCFDRSGTLVDQVVAEVTNTPWGERHAYVLDLRPEGRIRSGSTGADPANELLQCRQPKEFHVSPFMTMDVEYDWTLTPPGERLEIHIENRRQGDKVFDATLLLARRPIDGRNLSRMLTVYPLQTGRIFAGIYWQALRLWLKRVPYVPHPRTIQRQEASVL